MCEETKKRLSRVKKSGGELQREKAKDRGEMSVERRRVGEKLRAYRERD